MRSETHVSTTNQEVPLALRLLLLGSPDVSEGNIADVYESGESSRRNAILIGAIDDVPGVLCGGVERGQRSDFLLRWTEDHSER